MHYCLMLFTKEFPTKEKIDTQIHIKMSNGETITYKR